MTAFQPQYPFTPPAPPAPPAPAARTRRTRRRLGYAAGAAAVAAAVCAALAVTGGASGVVSGQGALGRAAGISLLPRGYGNGNGGYGGGGYGNGGYGSGGYGNGGYGLPGGGSGSTAPGSPGSPNTSGARASAAQEVGIVDIDTVLGYQSGAAAGTGMVLSPNGEVLTNNHVVDGATSIRVTVVATGRTYQAKVVGTDPTADVAVLQLTGASGLHTARLGDSANVSVGTAITGIGNAGGAGGVPSAAAGRVTALNQAITASDGNGANAEHLSGLIETNAQIQPGDSGGPLYNSSGRIVGMDTAAQTNGRQTAAAYAIPIDTAVNLAGQIESATSSTATIHLGYPAFLGVSVAPFDAGGVAIVGVLNGSPAAGASLSAGDVITGVDGTTVNSPSSLQAALGTHRPGDSVSITWADSSGQSHTARVVLATGPAD